MEIVKQDELIWSRYDIIAKLLIPPLSNMLGHMRHICYSSNRSQDQSLQAPPACYNLKDEHEAPIGQNTPGESVYLVRG